MRGHDGFNVVAGGQVGFDAGAEGGGESARHGCVGLRRLQRRGRTLSDGIEGVGDDCGGHEFWTFDGYML